MANALELYQAGRLAEAVAAAVEQVKSKPGAIEHRWLLCELLCFSGDLERADKHLDLISQQDPKVATTAALFRQLIRAETARQQFYADGRVPEVLVEMTDDMKLRLAASVRIREGATGEANELLAQAEKSAKAIKGRCDGAAFEDFRDLDDLTASVFEVLTSTGKYYWVPMQMVKLVEFRAPTSARDLLWRQARMVVEGGPDGEVYLPAVYPETHLSRDDRLRLGRSTEWSGGEGSPMRGIGQRMYLVGEEARGIGDLGRIELFSEGGSK